MENTTSSEQSNQCPTSNPVSEAAKIHQVLTWMLEGNSEHLIRETVESTWPGEDATPLIVKTLRHVGKSAELTRATAEDWSIEALKFLYQKQVEIGEYGGAMRAVRELAAMATKRRPKADQPEVVETFPRVLNVDDRRRNLAERIARRG